MRIAHENLPPPGHELFMIVQHRKDRKANGDARPVPLTWSAELDCLKVKMMELASLVKPG